MPHRVFIGVGSNLGDRQANCREAWRRVGELPKMRLVAESSLFESEPHGSAKTWFANCVIEGRTAIEPEVLLLELNAIEKAMGRDRERAQRWESRVIDLDILLYDDRVIDRPDLRIPHPEIPNRRFVLLPLCELAPQFIHPRFSVSISQLLARTEDKRKIHLMAG